MSKAKKRPSNNPGNNDGDILDVFGPPVLDGLQGLMTIFQYGLSMLWMFSRETTADRGTHMVLAEVTYAALGRWIERSGGYIEGPGDEE
jgi:hypothetical protein